MTALEEMADRIATLRKNAEWHRSQAAAYERNMVESQASAAESERIADEYAAVLDQLRGAN